MQGSPPRRNPASLRRRGGNSEAAVALTRALERVGPDVVNPSFAELADQLRGVAAVELGIVRSGPGLERALISIAHIVERAEAAPVGSLRDIFARADLRDLCATARACAASALHRRESRSAHYRSDFPNTDPAWMRTVFYDLSGIRTRTVEPDPHEARWAALRNAKPAKAAGEKEYVE